MTVTGEVAAVIYASTSGTDSDFVAKLIDVFPEDAEKVDWYTNPMRTARSRVRTPRSSTAMNSPSPWKSVAAATWPATSTRRP